MRVNPFVMPIILIVALVGTALGAQATGKWSVSGKAAIDVTKMTAADLKGWMTLQQVMDGLKMSKEDVYAAGKIPADVPTEKALKDLEALVPGFSTTGFRDAITAKLSGAPVAPSANTTPAPAAAATPAATPAATATHVTGTGTGPTPLPAGQVLPASQIKGGMSLKNVSEQCAVPLDKILTGLKLPANTDTTTLLKDLVTQGKITEVTDVQKVVEELQKK